MIYGSVCSGIEAATVAWEPLGWTPAWFAEIEPFPSAVLAHRWPGVENRGDFTKIHETAEPGSIGLLVGGTPCQSFSVAGLRRGLADPRGNLALEFLRLADAARPVWLVWENVPGVLSSHDGRDFGAFLGALGQLGYGWAYRILDAQHFGVPQRRRRVFVVGHLGDWRHAVAVLFERHCLSGHPPPGREAREGNAGSIEAGPVGPITIGAGYPRSTEHVESSHLIAFYEGSCTQSTGAVSDGSPPLKVSGQTAVAFGQPVKTTGYQGDTVFAEGDVWNCLASSNANNGGGAGGLLLQQAVRRLTPRECERLQGFPDDWTRIPWKGKPADQCPDGPRYRALGNSMAVPVMRWIGRRIALVNSISD